MSQNNDQFCRRLYKAGYLNSSYFNHKEMLDKVRAMVRTGMSRADAVRHVADQMGYSRQYVYRAIKAAREL